MPRYGWHGWDSGEDVTPPEPDKEWLTITDDGEEMAVIVHRDVSDDPVQNEQHRLDKERRAQRIVDALNATE